MNVSKVRNDTFDPRAGFDRGRGALIMGLWQLVKWCLFKTVFPWPSCLKVVALRLFGAKVGRGVYIKPQVNIHFPWKLEVGDHTWIGEEVYVLNFETIRLGSHVCLSQRSFLCGGNHDYRDPAMCYRNAPIVVEDGAWVGAQAFIAPGVTVGRDAVVSAGSVLLKDAQPGRIYAGNPAVDKAARWRDSQSS